MEMTTTREYDARSGIAGTRYSVKIGDVMTTEVVTVGPKTTFGEMVDALLEHDISGLPVVDARRHAGRDCDRGASSQRRHTRARARTGDVTSDVAGPPPRP
jgi:CBS domain-containing protein